jgi:hypothetical protein
MNGLGVALGGVWGAELGFAEIGGELMARMVSSDCRLKLQIGKFIGMMGLGVEKEQRGGGERGSAEGGVDKLQVEVAKWRSGRVLGSGESD